MTVLGGTTSSHLPSPAQLGRTDLVVSSILALASVAAFWTFSSGWSLRVTFVPGMVAVWCVVLWFYRSDRALPIPSRVWPLYFGALAFQFLHFAEEYVSDFAAEFPALYGGDPYPVDTFVVFNMASYAVFVIAALLWLAGGRHLLVVPALFFIIYGVVGNAVAHVVWSVLVGAYFPGLVTAFGFWVIAPILLSRVMPDRRSAAVLGIGFGSILTVLLVTTATPV